MRIICWSTTRMRTDSSTFNTSTELLIDLFFAAVFTSLRFEFVHGRGSRETVAATWSTNISNVVFLFAPFWYALLAIEDLRNRFVVERKLVFLGLQVIQMIALFVASVNLPDCGTGLDSQQCIGTFQSTPATSNAFPTFATAVSGHHVIVAVMFLTCVDYKPGIRWILLNVVTFLVSAFLWGLSALLTACPHTLDTINNISSGGNSSTSTDCDILASNIGVDDNRFADLRRGLAAVSGTILVVSQGVSYVSRVHLSSKLPKDTSRRMTKFIIVMVSMTVVGMFLPQAEYTWEAYVASMSVFLLMLMFKVLYFDFDQNHMAQLLQCTLCKRMTKGTYKGYKFAQWLWINLQLLVALCLTMIGASARELISNIIQGSASDIPTPVKRDIRTLFCISVATLLAVSAAVQFTLRGTGQQRRWRRSVRMAVRLAFAAAIMTMGVLDSLVINGNVIAVSDDGTPVMKFLYESWIVTGLVFTELVLESIGRMRVRESPRASRRLKKPPSRSVNGSDLEDLCKPIFSESSSVSKRPSAQWDSSSAKRPLLETTGSD